MVFFMAEAVSSLVYDLSKISWVVNSFKTKVKKHFNTIWVFREHLDIICRILSLELLNICSNVLTFHVVTDVNNC